MTKDEKELIYIAGGGLLVILAANSIGKFLGLIPTKESTAGVNNPIYNTGANNTLYTYNLASDETLSIAHDIYHANDYFGFNAFNYIMAAIKKCKSQGDVHQVVGAFNSLYKIDFYQYLKTGGGLLPWDGLSNQELAQFNTFVNSLPL